MMKLNDAFLAQRAQNAVHMDERKSRRITDMLLGERQIHLLDAVAWPLRPAAHEQFQNQAANELARIAPADAGEVIEDERDVAAQGAPQPPVDVRNVAHARVTALERTDQSTRPRHSPRAAGRTPSNKPARTTNHPPPQ